LEGSGQLHDAVESGVRDYDDPLMVWYSVLALCTQRTNDGRGSRQLTSFSWPWDSAIRTFCARPLSANDLKPFSRREQTRIAVQDAAYVSFWHV
jgi:hypothetical protein